MAAVSKIENGVIELHTDVGRLYVCPAGWQRLYLRWTFRNFHSLPREILNGRQKRLIDSLCRSAVVSPVERVPATAIIGVVENVKVLAVPSTAEVPEAAKVAHAGAPDRLPVLQARAESDVHSEPALPAFRLSPPEPRRAQVTPSGSEDVPATGLEDDTSLHVKRAERASVENNRRRPWAMTAASCAVVAVLLLAIYLPRQGKMQHSSSAPSRVPAPSAIVVEQQPVAAPPVAPVRPKPEAARESAKPNTLAAVTTGAGAGRRAANNGASLAAPKPAEAVAESAPLPVIAEAPRSGFIYPVPPNANLVGKVVLTAVVGSDGAVKQVEVVSGERALAAAAARAVKQWRYAPPQVGGRTVEAQTQVTISFLGDDAISIILPQPK